MLSYGAAKETTPANGFYSTLLLVPKKDGGQCPVINLKALNQCVQKQLQSADDRGLMVNTGMHKIHQSPQTASSHSSSPIICKDKGWYLNFSENQQHNSSGLHQPLGRTVSRELCHSHIYLWMWYLERNIHITAQQLPVRTGQTRN